MTAMPNAISGSIVQEHPSFSPERILLCQLRQIGDVLLSTISVRLLADAYPKAEIHFFTEKKCTPMLENNPHITKTWALDKKALRNLLQEVQFYKRIADTHFGLVVDFQQLPRCRWVVALSHAQFRLTTDARWYNMWLYTHTTKPSPCYAGAFKAQILKPLNIFWNNQRPELFLTEDEKAEAHKLFCALGIEDAPVISFDVSHRHKTRKWPAAYYAKIIEMLSDAYPSLRFFLPFGPGEEQDIAEVINHCSVKEKIAVPASMISLRVLAASIARCLLHVGNCSSPRHMAVALNVPTFTVLGSTSTGWTFPSPDNMTIAAGMPCQPCNKNTCAIGYKCLFDLTPETVFPALQKHIQTFTKLHK